MHSGLNSFLQKFISMKSCLCGHMCLHFEKYCSCKFCYAIFSFFVDISLYFDSEKKHPTRL